jgi:tetratricopeptide (TPR) repeat protein
MITGLGDAKLLARYKFNIGHCEWVFGLLDQALDTTEEAVSLFEQAGNLEDAGPAYCLLQWIHYYLGNLEDSLIWKQPAMEKFNERFDLRWQSWSLAAASWAYACLGRFDEAIAEASNELALCEEYQDKSLIAFAEWIMSIPFIFKQDFAKATEHAEASLENARTPADKVWAQTFLGWAWCRSGRAREAVDLLASILPLYEATQFVPGVVLTSAMLGEAYWRCGQREDAEKTLKKGLERATLASTKKFYVGWMNRILGEIATEQNLEQLAVAHFEKAVTTLEAIKAENELAFAYYGYGRLHGRLNRTGEATDFLTRALEIFIRLGTLGEPAKIRAELSEISTSS